MKRNLQKLLCLRHRYKDARFCRISNEAFSSLLSDVVFIWKTSSMWPESHVESSIQTFTFGQPSVQCRIFGSLRHGDSTPAYRWTPHPFSLQVKSFLNIVACSFLKSVARASKSQQGSGANGSLLRLLERAWVWHIL